MIKVESVYVMTVIVYTMKTQRLMFTGNVLLELKVVFSCIPSAEGLSQWGRFCRWWDYVTGFLS